jgi:transcriptional regulator with XRE-family HTH domain
MDGFKVNQLGERIKSLRVERGIGQNKLAEDLRLSNASISYWETGKQIPSAEVIYKLSKYFNVSADYLLGLKEW